MVDFVVEIDDISNKIVSCLGFIQTKIYKYLKIYKIQYGLPIG